MWLPPSESRQTFAFATTQTSRLLNLILSRQTGFFEFEHPFIDKPMVIIQARYSEQAWVWNQS